MEYRFNEIVGDCLLYQHVSTPTFQLREDCVINTLDLIFTTDETSLYQIETGPVFGNLTKGHLVLTAKLETSGEEKSTHKNIKFDYQKSNFTSISDKLNAIDWIRLFSDLSVQMMFDLLLFVVTCVCNDFVPKRDYSKMSKKHAPWITSELKSLLKKKRNLMYVNIASGNYRPVSLTSIVCKILETSGKARLLDESD